MNDADGNDKCMDKHVNTVTLTPLPSAYYPLRNCYLFSDNGSMPWASRQLLQAMLKLTELLLGFAITIQSWRHIAIAMNRFFLQGISAGILKNPYDKERSVDNGPAEHYWHYLQTLHSARLGNSTYGNSAANGLHLSDMAKHSYLQVSQQWHQLAWLGNGPPPLLPPEPNVASTIDTLIALAA